MAMQNDNLSMNDEFRQMKSDYENLKAGIDRQTIISGQLMEKVFRSRVSVLDSNRRNTIFGTGAAMLVTLAVSYIRGLDMQIAGIVAAFFALMLTGYTLIYRRLGRIEYGTDDILSTVTVLRKFKRNYMIVNTAAWVVLAGLMFFMLPEIHSTYRIPEMGFVAVAVMCVAVLAGICIQYSVDRKVLKACDDIICHLKDRS